MPGARSDPNHLNRLRHVVTDQLEAIVAQEMRDMVLAAGEKVIDAEDLMTLAQQALAEVRPQESAAAGYQDALAHPRAPACGC